MRKLRLFILLWFACLVTVLSAQTINEDAMLLEMVAQQGRNLHTRDTMVVGDSVFVLCDTIWDIYPHPLCMPLMYVPEPLRSITDTTPENPYTIAAIRKKARVYIATHHADLYTSVSDTNRLKQIEIGEVVVQRAIVKDIEQDKLDAARALRDMYSPWRKEANLSLQITQNYATENWHQGAANAFSMLWNAKAFANYSGEKLSWENSVEWRLGLSTVSGDTLRKVNTTDDKFQITSKIGYQLHPKWYVSLFSDFKTNLFPNFKKNSTTLNTAFLTPIRYNVGLGIDCKPIDGLTVNLSPATYKLVYAFSSDPTRVDVVALGIEEGTNLVSEIGSSLSVEWKWKPLREIEVETKFYFFTNYKQVETDLELDIDFIINKYLSARILLHPRYDGTIENVTYEPSKLQFKELISVGFSHTFR